MRNNFFIIFNFLFFILFTNNLLSNELKISSSEVKISKKDSKVLLKGKVKAVDENNNILQAEEAEYLKNADLLNSFGLTKIITKEKYLLESKDVVFDNKNKIIKSDFPTKIFDPDGNEIIVNMFNYNSIKNILFSQGKIQLLDKNKNIYKFSELYIDEKLKKIVGSDAKIFFNDNNMKEDPDNNPRIFANSIAIDNDITTVQKGVLTYCKFREDEKCPPWELRAKKIKHNSSKKTVYYDSAFLKIYDFPIFYFPKFSHPDPTVERRSGFLIPTITSSANFGAGLELPFFWNIAKDKDCEILKIDFFNFIKNNSLKEDIDLIFLDPPFKSENIFEMFEVLYKKNILKKNGLIVIHRHKNSKEIISEKFQEIENRSYGISNIKFFKLR